MSTQPTQHFQLSDGKEIKMYFGLLNRLAKLIGGFNTVALVLTDINVQEEVIKNLFNKYDTKGKVIEEANFEEMEYDPMEIQRLLVWVTEHLTSFFLKNLQSMAQVVGQFQTEMESNLEPLLNGTANSASAKQ